MVGTRTNVPIRRGRTVAWKSGLKFGRAGDKQEFRRLADFLRAETAQTLGYVGFQLAALEKVQDLSELHEGILEVRGEVREELRHILTLADELERTGQA